MKIKRSIAALASMAMLATAAAAAVPMSAGADDNEYSLIKSTVIKTTAFSDNKGTALTEDIKPADSLKFRKIMDIQDEANIPDCSFKFAVASGEAVDASATTLAVLAGPDPDKVVWNASTVEDNAFVASSSNTAASAFYELKYKANDVTLGEGGSATGAKLSVPDDNVIITDGSTTTYCAEKQLSLDFKGCGFTEPGVYRYIISETESVGHGVKNDPNVRTLDVYVNDASYYTTADEGTTYTYNKKLNIVGYTMYIGELTAGPSNSMTASDSETPYAGENYTDTITPNGVEVSGAYKTIGFKNEYPTYGLTFGKEVIGNQGSKDKYFKYSVKLENAPAGTYNVILSKTVPTVPSNSATKQGYIGKTNPNTITIDATGTKTVDFYLQDGQYIEIVGIAKGTKYTIEEEAEDYTSIEKISAANSSLDWDTTAGYDALNDNVSGTFNEVDIHTGFTNKREGLLPTGIILSVAGPAVVGIIALLGIAVLLIRGRRRRAEEE